jgi:hypothetical protein
MSETSKSNIIIWLTIPFLVIGIVIALLVAANRPPVFKVQSVKMPKPNGWDDLVKAADLACAIRPVGPYSSATHAPEKWTAAELEAWMQMARPSLDLVRVGLSKECMQPPARSYAMLFEGYAQLRELGRTIRSSALYYTVTGRPDEAANSVLDCMELGIVIQRGGHLITGLVGIAIESMPRDDLELLLPKLSSKDLERIASRMKRISAERVPYSDILINEARVSATLDPQAFRGLAAACDWNADYIYLSGKGNPSTLDRINHSARFAFASKTEMIAKKVDYLRALAKEQSKPYTGKSNVPVPDSPLISGYLDTFVRARVAFTRNEAIFAVLQTEVALRRYRAANHRYPDRLSELVPTYLKSMPIDTFGLDKALKYKSTKNGRSFVLYSVGPDMKDSGGTPIPDQNVMQSSIGDIVAGKLVAKP